MTIHGYTHIHPRTLITRSKNLQVYINFTNIPLPDGNSHSVGPITYSLAPIFAQINTSKSSDTISFESLSYTFYSSFVPKAAICTTFYLSAAFRSLILDLSNHGFKLIFKTRISFLQSLVQFSLSLHQHC